MIELHLNTRTYEMQEHIIETKKYNIKNKEKKLICNHEEQKHKAHKRRRVGAVTC